MKSKRDIQEGDSILINCAWSATERRGVVQSLLSTQFTWIDSETEKLFFTQYDGDWNYAER